MEQKIKFQKLTPTSDVDLSVYEDAFEYVFENADIRNVAISGPYSAGKSSLHCVANIIWMMKQPEI